MLTGISVTVYPAVYGVKDRLGNVVKTQGNPFIIQDVLVAPGSTDELEASRPNGVDVAYTIHLPKTYSGTLKGAEIELPVPWAGRYRVIGDPREYIGANTPTRWHIPVEIEVAHG